LADGQVDITTFKADTTNGLAGANLHNPFTSTAMADADFVLTDTPTAGADMTGTATEGQIIIDEVESGIEFEITGVGANNTAIPETLSAKR